VAIKSILGEPRCRRLRPSAVAIYSNPKSPSVADRGQCKEKGYDVVVKKDPFGGNTERRSSATPRASSRSSPRSGPTERLARSWRAHAGPWVTEQLGAGYFAVNWEPPEEAPRLSNPPVSSRLSQTLIASPVGDSTLADVTLPSLGESVTEGIITQWFKRWRHVARDEPLFEVSTDKVDSEMPSRQPAS